MKAAYLYARPKFALFVYYWVLLTVFGLYSSPRGPVVKYCVRSACDCVRLPIIVLVVVVFFVIVVCAGAGVFIEKVVEDFFACLGFSAVFIGPSFGADF